MLSLLDHVKKGHFVTGAALVVRQGVCEPHGRERERLILLTGLINYCYCKPKESGTFPEIS